MYQYKPEEWIKRVQTIQSVLKFNAGFPQKIEFKEIPWMMPRELKPSEISLTLKHLAALFNIAESNEAAVIMEDDVLVDIGSVDKFGKIVDYASQFDYIDLAGGCNLPMQDTDTLIAQIGGVGLYEMSPARSRNTAAYIITPKASLKLIFEIIDMVLPLDWSFQHAFTASSFKVAWTNPPLLIHGSMGHYSSSIQ